MWLDFGLRLVILLLTVLASSEARSGSQFNLQDVNRLAGCGEDINPSLCDSVTLSEECEKNSTVIQSCIFSCSQSGRLWWAASEGNLIEVNTAISAGANLTCHRNFTHKTLINVFYNTKHFINMAALHLAALSDHPGVAEALLTAGVDVNLQTPEGLAPIYYASLYSSIHALNVLIAHNADVNIAAPGGWTPLMFGPAKNGNLSIAKALINANANLDATGGSFNATALYYAVSWGNPEIALLLIEQGADVNIATKEGMTPLMRAAWVGHLNVVEALIHANASLDGTGGFNNRTALHYAIFWDHEDIVFLLIEHNADVNMVGHHKGETPLMMAAESGKLSIAKALINANASIDIIYELYNTTALVSAIRHSNNPDMALLLIEHNADVNIAVSDGWTPLMWASRLGQLGVANALINANASLDVTGGPDNATALHYTARYDRQDIALHLLQSGADTMIPAGDGRTAAEWARHHENYQLADIIESYSKSTTTVMDDTVTSS